MKAICWYGNNLVGAQDVPDPKILRASDAIVKVRLSSVCGSDLHLYNGFVPTMRRGDIIGHEFMGDVVEVGADVKKVRPGDRVVVPSVVACGQCSYCNSDLYSLCDNSNPHGEALDTLFGHGGAAFYGYSHAFGGYAGSHAEYIRVPYADVGAFHVPDHLTDEQAVFVSDAFPTGYMAADMGNIQPGDTVAVWGAGAVGLFAMRSAYMLGAERVIAIDSLPERLETARTFGLAAETLNFKETQVVEALNNLTGGRGPDVCIDAVGMEAISTGIPAAVDRVKQSVRMETGRPHVLREMIQACRKGGTLSIVGVYAGLVDSMPMGAAFNKGLTWRMGQMQGQKYAPMLLERIARGEIDPSGLVTHKMSLSDAQKGYQMFKNKQDNCIRVVFQPAM
ncbi:MAG: glutathione-dependent formaldehyde dehydrogenase [Anaerolineae bacterium]|nr:glutathione-dependent formaldehyde dehydrogenase [Anaerolineae bacterium]